MNSHLRPYRLAKRGGAGLVCDEDGLALGAASLADTRHGAGGSVACQVCPPAELGQILQAAYGPQTEAEVLRLRRGLCRATAWIEAGDLARAGVEAVMLGFPDVPPEAMAKLADIAVLQKSANTAWETEPRVPAGQPEGGQWTTGGDASSATAASSGRAPAEDMRSERPGRGQTSTSSGPTGGAGAASMDAAAAAPTDNSLLIPVSTASVAVGAGGLVGEFALPAGVARLGRAGLLAYAAGLLDRWDANAAEAQITRAETKFGLDPNRPANVLAAAAYVWSRYALPLLTDAPFSGPKLDAGSEAVMRLVMAMPGAFAAIQNPATPQNAALFTLIIRAADGGMVDYDVAIRARPPGVAPELQTTSRRARAVIADMLNSERQAHHLIPADVWKQKADIATLALRAGWKPDSPSNLIALPSTEAERVKLGELLPLHVGYHRLYNNYVASQIDLVRQNFPPNLTPIEARAILEAVALGNWVKIVKGEYNPIMKAD